MVDFINNLLKGRNDYSPSLKKYLNFNGKKLIDELWIYRAPINSILKKIADFLTVGKFSQSIKNLHYDDIFHLGILFRIDNQYGLLEKNHVIEINKINRSTTNCKLLKIKEYKTQTTNLNDLLYNAKKGYSSREFFCL